MNTTCKKCGKQNHWAPVCKTPEDKINKTENSQEKVENRTVSIKSVKISIDQPTSTPLAEIFVRSPDGTVTTTM